MTATIAPASVATILLKLYTEFGFVPTLKVFDRHWTWRHRASDTFLPIRLPVTIDPVFYNEGKNAGLSSDRGHFSGQYALYLLDHASAVAHGTQRQGKLSRAKLVFTVDQEPILSLQAGQARLPQLLLHAEQASANGAAKPSE
jgi:hypothetical protein